MLGAIVDVSVFRRRLSLSGLRGKKMKFLIEVEESKLTTYEVYADNETNARMLAKLGDGRVVEEHEQSRIVNCDEVFDD